MSSPSIEVALRRAALLFRALAVAWMMVMVGISLVTDSRLNPWVVVAAVVLAVAGGAWSARYLASSHPLDPRFLGIDGAIALAVALAPQLAGSSEAFYGGYPMSAVVMFALARHLRWGLGAAAAFSLTQLMALLTGAASAPTPAEWVSLTIMAGIVALVVGQGAEFLRTEERRRREAEHALAEETRRHEVDEARLEERLAVADDLHDSLLQTVRVIGQSAEDADRVRSLARRQERELRGMIERMQHPDAPGAAAELRAEAADVEDLHGVVVDVVVSGDVALDERVTGLLRAVREAMVNAARHSGADRVDVTWQVRPGQVAAVVRDRGRGFDPTEVEGGHGLSSIRNRMNELGGQVRVLSTTDDGTEVELTLGISK